MRSAHQQHFRRMRRLIIVSGVLWLYGTFMTSHAAAAHSQNLDLTVAEQAWLAAHPVIRIAGMASGYIAILQDRLGIQVKPYPELLWPEVLQRAQNRELDVITCAARSADREQYLLFSTPYLSFPMVIVTRRDTGFLSGLKDLYNVSIAVIGGTSTYVWMQRDRIGILPYPERFC